MKSDKCLLFSCPHCNMEYIMAGIDIDKIQNCLCPDCKGCCDIWAINENELDCWLMRFRIREALFDVLEE